MKNHADKTEARYLSASSATSAVKSSPLYDAANRLTGVDGVSYTWDARGNLRSNGVFTYTYDGAGRMVRAESVSATVVYTYGLDSLLVGRSAGGAAATYAWDWATGVPEMLSDGERLYLVGKETLGWADGAEWSYPLGDALGSVRQVVDGAGEVLDDRTWTPFGVEEGTAQGGLGYTGEWWDAEVSLLYLRARWYDPAAGRLTTEDPWEGDWERPQTANGWSYADGNPVSLFDPSGLYSLREIKSFFDNAYSYNPDVLGFFEPGSLLAGRWGWLEVLRHAQDGYMIRAKITEPWACYSVQYPPDVVVKPWDGCFYATLSVNGIFEKVGPGLLISNNSHRDFALLGSTPQSVIYDIARPGTSSDTPEPYPGWWPHPEWVSTRNDIPAYYKFMGLRWDVDRIDSGELLLATATLVPYIEYTDIEAAKKIASIAEGINVMLVSGNAAYKEGLQAGLSELYIELVKLAASKQPSLRANPSTALIMEVALLSEDLKASIDALQITWAP